AVAAMERALALFEALPAPADAATALLDIAELALAGRPARGLPAGAWLSKATGIFQRLGDRRNRERALALHVEWLRRSQSPRSEGGKNRDLIESVSRLLHWLSDLRELTQRAMQLVMEQLDAERGVLLLTDQDTGRLVPIAEFGTVDPSTRKDAVGYSRRVVERVAESGGSLLIGDAPSNPGQLSESMMNLRLRSILCVPMFLGGKVVGAVYLDDSRRPEAFGDQERALMEGFAHLMAVAIEKSRGEEEVRRANEMLVGENLSLRKEAVVRFQPVRLIGVSSAMQAVKATIERAALTNTTVLLTGENGTGKELIARILHHAGKRRLKPFVAVNCGALPEALLESELFGILPNVATGVRGRDGRFQQADGGSLFLDEIGDMPLKQQVALLAAISNREITPVGGGKPIHVDVRIIAATNRDLGRMVEDGSFREDLFYRLNVIPIEVPALRERKADVPALAQHFVAHFAQIQERKTPEVTAEFLAAVMQSDWPGNVRELQNYIERVMAMTPGDALFPVPPPRDMEERASSWRPGRGRGLTDSVEEFERRIIEDALEKAQGNQSLAARQLGVPEQAIRYRIKKYGLIGSRQNRRIRRQWR
ncbi:MAG TPA: sigma-54-dependent Fis family transcriptional regulator, partial [Usitatibacter sp.]|nr:sigma-54-dependent Fis family transcriptional regulator [Usitatibacter sp.]